MNDGGGCSADGWTTVDKGTPGSVWTDGGCVRTGILGDGGTAAAGGGIFGVGAGVLHSPRSPLAYYPTNTPQLLAQAASTWSRSPRVYAYGLGHHGLRPYGLGAYGWGLY